MHRAGWVGVTGTLPSLSSLHLCRCPLASSYTAVSASSSLRIPGSSRRDVQILDTDLNLIISAIGIPSNQNHILISIYAPPKHV